MFQESGEASSDNMQRLIGHWRKTTIVFESPKDEHLVLHAVTGRQTGRHANGHLRIWSQRERRRHLQKVSSTKPKFESG